MLSIDQTSGRAYVPAYTNQYAIDVVDTASGAVLRTIPVSSQIETLAPDSRTGHLFVTYVLGGPTLDVFKSVTGLHARTVSLRPYVVATAVLAVDGMAGRLYVAGERTCPNTLFCPTIVQVMSTSTGAFQRIITLSGAGGVALAIDHRARRVIVVNAAQESHGIPLTLVDTYDARDDRLVHRTRLSIQGSDAPLIADAATGRSFVVLYAPTSYPEEPHSALHPIAVFDTRTGALLRTTRLADGAVALALDAPAGLLFATTYGTALKSGLLSAGRLYALDARTGRVLRGTAIGPATTALAVDAARGRVYVAGAGQLDPHAGYVDAYAGRGTLTVLDARTGAVLRRWPLGRDPESLALDAAHQRLLVASASADSTSGGRQAVLTIFDTARL